MTKARPAHQSAWANVDGRITRYSRPYDKVVAKSCAPKRTGSQEQLYTHRGVAPERAAYLETLFFAPVDSNAAIAHQRLLSGGVSALSPDQREVVLLRIVADLPVEEVARILDKREGAIKALQHRALNALRRHLDRQPAWA